MRITFSFLLSACLMLSVQAQISTIQTTTLRFDNDGYFDLPGGGSIVAKKTVDGFSGGVTFSRVRNEITFSRYDKDNKLVKREPAVATGKFGGMITSLKKIGDK